MFDPDKPFLERDGSIPSLWKRCTSVIRYGNLCAATPPKPAKPFLSCEVLRNFLFYFIKLSAEATFYDEQY